LSRLHKKEEDAYLNKKKKREETKQKNKYEKNKLNNINSQNHYNYYPGMYMPPMQINNQNPAYYNEYQNYFYLNPSNYPMGQQFMGTPYYPQFFMAQNSLEDTLNMIYNRGIVNNIIGAFYIKECKERQKQRQAEKRTVPISQVELNDEQEEIENNNDNNNNNDIGDESNNKLSYAVKDFKLKSENQENNNNENEGENNLNKNEQGEIEEKNEENDKKEEENNEHSIHNDNELKKPSMV
jgi:hypothetical protein